MALVPMRTIPDVELHVFPNCGHWAMIEQKSAWEAVVLAFLTEGRLMAATTVPATGSGTTRSTSSSSARAAAA